MNLLKNYRLEVAGIIVGGILGYAYYYFVGCASGTCAITSKPMNSTLYGMIMGYLLFSVFKNAKNKKQENV